MTGLGRGRGSRLGRGRGSRLGDRTKEIPKALLPIGPRSLTDRTETTFLRRQSEQLYAAGVKQIVIVVGTLKQQIIDDVKHWDIPVTLVENPTPDMGISGSLHSFQYAVRSPHGILDVFTGSRVAAERVRPDAGERDLAERAPGDQHPPVGAEHVARERQVQGGVAVVDHRFVGGADGCAALVEQHHLLDGLSHGDR